MCTKKEKGMDNKNQIEIEQDTKKLAFVVVYMSMVVAVLFGLVPLI
jgi:hypothetical protein